MEYSVIQCGTQMDLTLLKQQPKVHSHMLVDFTVNKLWTGMFFWQLSVPTIWTNEPNMTVTADQVSSIM